MITYTFGQFVLHDNVTYFVESIDGLSPIDITVTTAKIARTEGLKRVGETVDMRKITITMSIVTPDRDSLVLALDALNSAMSLHDKPLVLFSDGRYFIANCTRIAYPIKSPSSVIAQLEFSCYQPYAYASTQNQIVATGNTNAAFQWSVAGGGTIFSHPTITITNTDASHSVTNPVLLNVTANQQLGLLGGFTMTPGQYILLVGDPFTNNSLTAAFNGNYNTLIDFQGVFPTLDIGTTIWQLSASATNAAVQVQMSWIPRYR